MKADLELVQDAKRGDRQAFAELVSRHQRLLLRAALRMTRDWEAAEDIVQESFLKAYQGLASFAERSSFRSWAYQITLNTARNRLRGQHRETVSLDDIDLRTEAGMDQALTQQSTREMLRKEVEQLPKRQRMALTLRIYDDLSFKEIADIMGCPYDTAKANYRHALLKLRQRMASQMSNNPMADLDSGVWVEAPGPTAEAEG